MTPAVDPKADPGRWFLCRMAELGLQVSRGAGDMVLVSPPGRTDAKMRRFIMANRLAILAAIDGCDRCAAQRDRDAGAAEEPAPPPAPKGKGAPVAHKIRQPNTTPVPDVFFDEIAPDLDESELRVLLYLVRRTLGFRRESDAVSFTQFCTGIVRKDGRRMDKGTGLSRSAVGVGLAGLVDRGLVLVEQGSGRLSNTYRLVLHDSTQDETDGP